MSDWNRLSNIHLWNLNENSTRFDQASAAPTDDELYIQWVGTATIAGVVAFFTFLLMLSILRVPTVRNKSFNCYILAVLLPDFQFSLSCSITCTINAINRRYVSEAMCGWQTWYAVFGFGASCWMNAVISNQLYTMLKTSHFRGRYNAPSIRHVAKQTLIVYFYAACLATLATCNGFGGIPFRGGAYQGYACLPKDYDDASTIFFWLGFLPLCVLIPLVYVLWCLIRVWRGGMLPPPGQRSTLWMYFSLIFVFTLMWLPFIVITFIWGPASPSVDSTWVLWAGAQFSHFQGLATVWTILFKQDIRTAFLGTVTCGKYQEEREERSQGISRSGSHSRTSNTRRLTRQSTEQTHTYASNQRLQSRSIRHQSSIVSHNFSSVHEILGPFASQVDIPHESRDKDEKKEKDSDEEIKGMAINYGEVGPNLRGFQDLLEEGSRESNEELSDKSESDSSEVPSGTIHKLNEQKISPKR